MKPLNLNGSMIVQKGVFGILGNAHILVNCPTIFYQRLEVYRVETMDMGKLRWNNGVIGKCNPSKYYSTYCTGHDI